MRRRGVAAAAADGRADRVRGGQERTRPQGDRARRVVRADVDRERPRHAAGAVRAVLQQALLDHEAGAVVALLARLEHQQDPSGQRRHAAPRAGAPPRAASRRGCRGRRHASRQRSRRRTRGRCPRVSGRPSMSARSRIVGPGRAPSMTADHRVGRLARPALEPDRARAPRRRSPASPGAGGRSRGAGGAAAGPRRRPGGRLGPPPGADGSGWHRLSRGLLAGDTGVPRLSHTRGLSDVDGWHNAPTRRAVRGRRAGRSRWTKRRATAVACPCHRWRGW